MAILVAKDVIVLYSSLILLTEGDSDDGGAVWEFMLVGAAVHIVVAVVDVYDIIETVHLTPI